MSLHEPDLQPNARRALRRADRQQAANLGLSRLREVETAIELAYSATAELAADLPRLRADANLSTVVGQPVFEELSRTLGHLTAAMNGIVRTHGELSEVGRQVRVRPTLEGVPDKEGEAPKG